MTGPEFAALRRSKGLTQRDLAQAAGMKYQHIQRLEYGDRSLENLHLQTASKIAEALKIPVTDLLK
jgi:transcriptional regulator with XRE-family HTH domain